MPPVGTKFLNVSRQEVQIYLTAYLFSNINVPDSYCSIFLIANCTLYIMKWIKTMSLLTRQG